MYIVFKDRTYDTTQYSRIDWSQKRIAFASPSTLRLFDPSTGESLCFDDSTSFMTPENAAVAFRTINYSLLQGIDMLVLNEDVNGKLWIQQYYKPIK